MFLIQEHLDEIQHQTQLMWQLQAALQLHNANVSIRAPLLFPPNVVLPANYPQTKQDLSLLTSEYYFLHILL